MRSPLYTWFGLATVLAVSLPAAASAQGLRMQSLSLSGNRGPQPTNPDAPGIAPGVGITQKLRGSVPLDARFVDEQGQERPLAAYLGSRPLVLVPVYYRCPILCSQVLGGLAGSLKGMSLSAGQDFQVVALSFDPTDTPALADAEKARVMRRYRRPGTESGWHFLTGSPQQVDRVLAAIGYGYSYDAQTHQYAHPAAFVVLTPEGRISRYFIGLDVAPRELRLALVEAAAEKIGSPIDRLALYCYRYNLWASKYGARILRALRLGGLLTVVGLLGLLLGLWRRELRAGQSRRQSRQPPDPEGWSEESRP